MAGEFRGAPQVLKGTDPDPAPRWSKLCATARVPNRVALLGVAVTLFRAAIFAQSRSAMS